MADKPGVFERLNRMEWDNPVKFNLFFIGTISAFAIIADWRLGLTFLLVMLPLRLWLMRPGGWGRKAYARRYEWAKEDPPG
jgi:hypothetical protein